MSDVFLEVIMDAKSLHSGGIFSRDMVEDDLNLALETANFGEVVGGGAGSGKVIIDVEIWDESQFEVALDLVRRVLQQLEVPRDTIIKRSLPEVRIFPVYV